MFSFLMDDVLFRMLLSGLTALIATYILGAPTLRYLSKYKVGQTVRDDGPQSHLSKAGTPTMGGVLIVAAVTLSTVLWCDLQNRFTWLLLLVLLSFAALGFYDDYKKLVKKDPNGLPARWKYLGQSVIALLASVVLYVTAQSASEIDLFIPYVKLGLSLNILYIVLTYFVIVGTSNAVNLTDGLDGLVTLPIVLVAFALAIFGLCSGHMFLAEDFALPFVSGAADVAVFCSAIVGSGLAFLWFNTYPADMFMGDVGSLSLGAALGTAAVLVRQELLLIILGGVFVAETLSVMLQVGYFKKTGGKRILKMAPLHHHFELSGLSEPKVVIRFWIVSIVLVIIGMFSLYF